MQKQRIISIVFIWISINILCFAQDLSNNIAFANTLRVEGKIELSLKEHLRVFYLDKNNEHPSITKSIGQLFTQMGNQERALKYYNLYQFSLPFNDPSRASISFEKAKIHLSASQYQEAILELLQINKRSLSSQNRYNYYLGLSYLFTDKYDIGIAKFKLLDYLDQNDLLAFDVINERLLKNHNINPKRARLLSVIIPGLGQTVNGQFRDGINSFVLVGGLTYFMLDLAQVISLPNSILSFGPWIFRYYAGGIANAKNAALLKKTNRKNDLILELLQIIEDKRQLAISN